MPSYPSEEESEDDEEDDEREKEAATGSASGLANILRVQTQSIGASNTAEPASAVVGNAGKTGNQLLIRLEEDSDSD